MKSGTVVAAHGRHYWVQIDSRVVQCVTRGKKSDVAVGDLVHTRMTSPDQAVIEQILNRDTLLYRSDQYRSKLLAANVTKLFIVVATEPSFSDDLISRSLIAAEAAGIQAHIVLNKIDLTTFLLKAREQIKIYAELGYPVHEISVRTLPDVIAAEIIPLLKNQVSVLIGQSGMGKSSLINLIVPHAEIRTKEISVALNTGKHTTTYTCLHSLQLSDGAWIRVIDSPGFQEFGLAHLTEGQLERAFPEFAAHLGKCRFTNCHHHHEPGCAITDAVSIGTITPARHALFLQLVREASHTFY